jgi:hypothetical protein
LRLFSLIGSITSFTKVVGKFQGLRRLIVPAFATDGRCGAAGALLAIDWRLCRHHSCIIHEQ